MKILKFENREDWLESRIGQLTGTKVKDIIVLRGTGRKVGFWKLIAERVADEPDGENVMERGVRLEPEAMERFIKETGKKVDTSLVMWVSDDNPSMRISPDGFMGKTEAVEVKCLNSASHIEALYTQTIPADYHFQVIQYFVVNDNLKKLYVAFYDPRIKAKDFFYITVTREEVEAEVAQIKAEELEQLKEIERITLELSNF